MRVTVAVVIIALSSVLTVGVLTPAPAHASDTDTAIIAGLATAAYVGIVFLCTRLVFKAAPDQLPPLEDPRDRRDQVRFGTRCALAGDRVTVLCW